jgi:hypothetical protein
VGEIGAWKEKEAVEGRKNRGREKMKEATGGNGGRNVFSM